MLKTRTLSALVMAPPALAAVWAGGYAFAALIAVAAALMCWEWTRMLTGSYGVAGRLSSVLCAVAVLVAVISPVVAAGLVPVIAVGAALASPAGGRAWAALGGIYVAAPSVAMVWLRQDPSMGGIVVAWILLLVWATDIGAYGFGRLIGGPLLMPAVSPKKTWAGLLGGMVCAGAVGGGVALWGGAATGALATVVLMSGAAAVVAQAGDLFESWIKRRCGVKDSSNIIPGHGGVLDRVDGVLSVAVTMAVLTLVAGRPVLAW